MKNARSRLTLVEAARELAIVADHASRGATAGFVALAGPEVPDRIFTGERFGIVGADLIVVASRPKPEWTPGTVLECGDRWLRVGEALQRSLPVGLGTVYPLVNMPDAAVFRRVVHYELPHRLG